MKKGAVAALLFIIVLSMIIAQAAIAAEGDKRSAPGRVAKDAQEKIDTAKETAAGKVQTAREMVQDRKDAAIGKMDEKRDTTRENLQDRRDAMQDKRKDAMEHRRQALQEKKVALRTKVAVSDIAKVEALDRSRLKELSDLTPEQAKMRLQRLTVVRADEGFKIRPMAAEKMRERMASFKKLEGDEEKLRMGHAARIQKVKEAKEKLRSCGNETNDECGNARADAIEKAKEAALKMADRLIAHLNKLKERIQGSENMAEEEITAKVARIDAAIAEIEAIKQRISAATTKEEFNAAAKELRKLVNKAKRISHAHAQGIFRAEIHGVIHRSEVSEKKLDCALAGLEGQGVDTAAVDEKIAEFSSTMGSAREKLKQAKELLQTEEEVKIEEAKALIREAKDLVKQAHQLLEEIRKDIRALGGTPCQGQQEITIEQEAPPPVPTIVDVAASADAGVAADVTTPAGDATAESTTNVAAATS